MERTVKGLFSAAEFYSTLILCPCRTNKERGQDTSVGPKKELLTEEEKDGHLGVLFLKKEENRQPSLKRFDYAYKEAVPCKVTFNFIPFRPPELLQHRPQKHRQRRFPHGRQEFSKQLPTWHPPPRASSNC